MISQKIRNNASISYFFLGWLFLLAKNNPNFSDVFIKQHAKAATKVHVFFFVSYFLYSHFLSGFFGYVLPIVQITIDHCIQIALFSFLTLFIIQGVYKGQKGESREIGDSSDVFSFSGNILRLDETSEGQKAIYFLSYIPFLGMIIAKKHPHAITTSGARISSIFWFFYLLVFVNRGFDSLSMMLLFMGVLFLVYLAAGLFIKNSYFIPHVFEKIPSIALIYEIIRSTPTYFMNLAGVAFGKTKTLQFAEHLANTRTRDIYFRTSLEWYFTDAHIAFSSLWIFIPFCNVIFIPKLFMSRQTRYVLAIGQGLVLTVLAGVIGYFYGFASPFELFLLFPIFYGIAEFETNVFVRIPGVYEIYAILNTLTFGILNNTKRMQDIQKKETTVSYKVE